MRREALTGLFLLVLLGLPFLGSGAFAQIDLQLTSVAPASRSIASGETAGVFATIQNVGKTPAKMCGVKLSQLALSSNLPIVLSYQATNSAGASLEGSLNTPVSIAAGATQSFLVKVKSSAEFPPTDVALSFNCENVGPAPFIVGLDTVLMSATPTGGPDIISLAASSSNNAVAALPSPTGTGGFAVAAKNVGDSGTVTVSADTGRVPLPVRLTLCETNSTGSCLAPAATLITVTSTPGANQTFGVFVAASAAIPADDEHHRVYVRFRDSNGNLIGSSSIAIENASWSGPLIIDKGGTYSGQWESQDPNTPAVQINTTEPVTIQNCFIRSKANLITGPPSNGSVTIENCRGYGLDPLVAGYPRGYFFNAYAAKSLTFEHNYVEGASFGVHLGTGYPSTVTVRYNLARNLFGSPSNGKGGVQDIDTENGVLSVIDGSTVNHFAVLDRIKYAKAEISWNEIINEPYIGSMGDSINVCASSGTSLDPIEVSDNFIYGGYGVDPVATPGYTGAGIQLDGCSATSAATATAFVRVHDNQAVNIANCGMCISAGHDNEMYSNRLVSTGLLPNGQVMAGNFAVGMFIINNYDQNDETFFNNYAHENVTAWFYRRGNELIRFDYYFPACGVGDGGETMCTDNLSLPGSITSATEANEYALWQKKLAANHIQLGPLTAGPTLPPPGFRTLDSPGDIAPDNSIPLVAGVVSTMQTSQANALEQLRSLLKSYAAVCPIAEGKC